MGKIITILLIALVSIASARQTDAKLQEQQQQIHVLNQKIQEQNERIDGLVTIVEGLMSQIEGVRGQTPQSNQEELLRDLASMIDKINENYVTKEELARATSGKNSVTTTPEARTSESEMETSESEVATSDKDLVDKSPEELYQAAVLLYRSGEYEQAKNKFLVVDKNGFQGGAVNYYLGEIAYYTKKYDDAIFHFKKSVGFDDKASYMDTLLLHTGIALENTNDNDQAKLFYENIIANYPSKPSANIAKTRMDNLK